MIVTMVTLSYFPALFGMMGIDRRIYGFVGGLSLFPLAFKAFIGPLSDRFPIPFLRGKRKGYIILGGVLNIIFLPFLYLNPLSFFTLFFTLWFFQTLGIAIMDVMTDTLAIDEPSLQTTQGRTEASVIMFLGSFCGGFIVTQFIPLLMTDLQGTLALFALISIIPVALVIFLKEKEKGADAPLTTEMSYGEKLKHGFKYPFVWWGIAFAFMLNIDGGLLELTLEPYLVMTLGVPIQAVVSDLFYITLVGNVLGFAGYFFIDRIKKNRLLIIIALVYIIPLAILGFLTSTNSLTYNAFLWLYGVFSLVSGLSFITYTAFFFDLSSPKAAGTMIALFLTVCNLGRLLGIVISGFFTISTIYFIAVILTALRILPLWRIKMSDIEAEFYEKRRRTFTKMDVLFVVIPAIIVTVTLLWRFL